MAPTPWRIEWDDGARRDLRRLGRPEQEQIIAYLRERIATTDDPRRFGKPLRADLAGLWRYRINNYRLICRIEDQRLVVLVVTVGHRRDVFS